MKKKILQLLVISFVCCLFNSCDEIVFNYSNPWDLKSENYTPEGPRNLSIYTSSLNLIMLYWVGNSAPVSGFIIERSIATSDNFVEIGRTGPNLLKYDDSYNFSLNTDYYYRVSSFNGEKRSVPSNVAVKRFDFKAPSNLSFKGASGGTVILNWTNNSSFDTGFNIETRIPAQESAFRLIAALPSKYAFYEIKDLEKGKLYEFRICATTGNITSGYSNTVTYKY